MPIADGFTLDWALINIRSDVRLAPVEVAGDMPDEMYDTCWQYDPEQPLFRAVVA